MKIYMASSLHNMNFFVKIIHDMSEDGMRRTLLLKNISNNIK